MIAPSLKFTKVLRTFLSPEETTPHLARLQISHYNPIDSRSNLLLVLEPFLDSQATRDSIRLLRCHKVLQNGGSIFNNQDGKRHEEAFG